MSTLYINQPISIEIDCTLDGTAMSTATSAIINYQKPDKTTGSWTAAVNNTTGVVSYSATALDIDQTGTWVLQPVVTFPTATALPGTSIDMEITARFL